MDKKSVLITGCSDGGIGGALALAFAQRGLLVFATTRKIASMSKLTNLPNVRLLVLDITNQAQIHAAVEAVKKETGGSLDYLVNNAAQGRFMPLLDEAEGFKEAKELFDLNLWAQLSMVQAFTPLLMEAKGTVAYISSLATRVNMPWLGMYAMSKSAAEIMFDTLRLELAPFGIKVTKVMTATVASNSFSYYENWSLPEDSLYGEVRDTIKKRTNGDDGVVRMDTHEYAEIVVPKIMNGDAVVWSGHNAGVIKLMLKWLPTWFWDWAMKKDTGVDVMLKKQRAS